MSMSVPEKPTEFSNRIEYFLRRLFERIGGALDFALRRPLNPQPRTDLSSLLPQLERALDEKLRHEGARIIAPNLIELRYDYETYAQMGPARIDYLQRELATSLYEYIVNRRYTTLGAVKVIIAFDVFTRRLTIKAEFPDEAKAAAPATAASQAEAVSAAKSASQQAELALRPAGSNFAAGRVRLGEGLTAGVGRSHDNALVITDATVSSFHAAFSLTANGTLWLADLGSSNGTFVNGVRLTAGDKSLVRSGDKVQFGDLEFTLTFTLSAA